MAEFVTRCDVMPQICKRHCMEITKNVAILMDRLRMILTCDFNIQILWSMKCCGTQPLIFRERYVQIHYMPNHVYIYVTCQIM